MDTANWKALLRCQHCAQLWAVDEWDKYQIQLAVKITDKVDWQTSDEAYRKAHLTQSRGVPEMLTACGVIAATNS
jgi:hypothetical protein